MADEKISEGRSDHVANYKNFCNPFSYGSTIKLDGSNYEVWSRTFMMSMVGHRKDHIIDENEPENKVGKYITWKEDNSIVMAWIINSVQPEIASGLCYYKTAKHMWESLRQTYSQNKNVSRILQVEQEIFNLQQGDQDLAQYFFAVKSVYEKLNTLQPPCESCKSNQERTMVARFLSGLSPDFTVAKEQIVTGSKIPSLDETYNQLSCLVVSLSQNSSESSSSALAVSGGCGRDSFPPSGGKGGGRGTGAWGKLQCTYCGKLGHLEDRCWFKHGRPPSASTSSLASQNFEKLFGKFKELNIDNVVALTDLVCQIFDKALMEPTLCEMYADLCSRLVGALPDLVVGNKKVTFKRLLLNKCQEEFERAEKEDIEANKDGEDGEAKQSGEEREEKRTKARRRMLGNIQLIGELYKKKLLTERIMHECIKKLLGRCENPDEEDVEALCKLMGTIGAIIDHPIAKKHMDAYFDRMQNLSTNQKLSSRMRFMLRDTIDLRKNKWEQRRKVEGPKKIEEVHRDAAQEHQSQSGSCGSCMNSSARRGQAIDYGPSGSTGLSSPGSQLLASLRGMPASGGFGTQDVWMEDRHILESRTLSVPLPQRSIDDHSITQGPQGALAKGMSVRGQPSMSSGSVNYTSVSTEDARRMGIGLSGFSSTHSLADWATHGSQEEIGSRGILLDNPKSAHSYGQPNHKDRISRDARNSPVSWTGAHSSMNKLPEEQLRERSIYAIKEFYSANDEEEVASCVKELNAPNFFPTMVSLWVTDSFERKSLERDRLTKLLVFLCKSRNHLLSQVHLIKGFESVFATLPDAIYDAPKAPEFLGGILAKVILEKIISLKDVGRLIQEEGEEPGSLTESGIASDVLGSILEVVRKEKGDTVLEDICRDSEIRLEEFLPPDPRKQAKLMAFI